MALKLLLIILILYWIMRVALNLWRAVVLDTKEREESDIFREVSGQSYEQQWYAGSGRSGSRREENVEEADWRDV